ncbi:carbohydrate ABC transporter permease [Glycomyces harbinensis]|uniref:Multiple sugar transport system permease protein/putative aldouronate transport system permease protein n=1 Tax=Glycomyces harbinensis TaxID=58114 RepID=A0A1G6WXX8_9ACTN|nr:carbohydrate ABC transporter permease [Glycomyces harbinensis]SDD70503.1 multiple sugar transport system permease protein/putative aldouronate transport system permease protein [Glycomyces harbinensis]
MTVLTSRKPVRRNVNGTPPPGLAMRGAKGLILLIACALVVVPFLSVVSTSLADQQQITEAGGYVLWPERPNLDAYRAILAGGVVTRALFVSVGVTLVGTLLSLACTALLAYALSRPGSFAHKPLLMTVLFTLFFTPGIIPMYLLIRSLGLLDSYWSLILPVLVNAFQVLIMRAFFMEIPRELIDAARIDGAGELHILTRIVLPLSKAVLAVIGLFQAVAFWNAFFNAVLYINDTAKWPLQLVLRTYVVDNTSLGVDGTEIAGATLPASQSIQMAILVVSLVPIALVYPFLQRHFAKGLLIGAVKG